MRIAERRRAVPSWSACASRCRPRQRRTTHSPLAHTATEAPSRASTEELLLELRRRIIAPRTRRHDTWDDWDGGLDPHGDWPEEVTALTIFGGAVSQADPNDKE